jgi:RNA polymerase-binding transcription factor DksA
MTARTETTRSDAAQLSADDLGRLRASLIADLEAQRREVVDLQATAESLTGQSDSDSLLERELAQHGAAQGVEVISDIQHALARIDAGDYGVCERCRGPIARARLEAIPHTRFCVNCPPTTPRLIT